MLGVAGAKTTADADTSGEAPAIPLRTYGSFAGTVKPVHFISYSETPWKPGEPMLRLRPAEVEAKIGADFHFLDGVYVNIDEEESVSEALGHLRLNKYSPWYPQSNYLIEAVRYFLAKENYPQLVLCHSDSGVGHMVVAARDISMGDVVAIYSGVLNYKKHINIVSSEHVTGVKDEIASAITHGEAPPIHLERYSVEMPMEDDFPGALLLNAERIGGIARFFNHLPLDVSALIDEHLAFLRAIDRLYLSRYVSLNFTEQQAENIRLAISTGRPLANFIGLIFCHFMRLKHTQAPTFSTRVREGCDKKIAIANLYIRIVKLPEMTLPLSVLIACSSIKAGEQLGWDYADSYAAYLKAVQHLYFDRQSKEPINPEDLIIDASEARMTSVIADAGSPSLSAASGGAGGPVSAGPGVVSDSSGASASSAASSMADSERKLSKEKIMQDYLNFAVFFIARITLQGEWLQHPKDSTGLTYFMNLKAELTEVDFERSKKALKTAGFFLSKTMTKKGGQSILAKQEAEMSAALVSLYPK